MIQKTIFSIAFSFFFFASFAQPKNAAPGTVTIWELGDPDRLNPITSTSASSRYIQNCIFSRLLEFDPLTMKLVPQIATALPTIELLEKGSYKGGMSLTFEIDPKAVWDNGSPVTANDYIFTIKAIKNPLVNAGSLRPYYEFIAEIVIDPKNPRKFTIFSHEPYFLAEESCGDIHILPEYIYDPTKTMRKFTLPDLSEKNKSTLEKDKDIINFANAFNDSKFDREVIVGSNAYQFVEWTTGQQVVLERKKDWWGEKKDGIQYPKKLIYKTVRDQSTAITLAKEEQIDVLRGILPQKFVELNEDPEFTKKLNFYSPPQFAYYYIGINTKNPILSDQKVRRALAHLVDRASMIETLFNGLATITNGPISPYKSYYNKDLKSIDFDVEAAKKLLAEAGWKDSNDNGILDKMIDGKTVELKLRYKYNQGNEIRKNIGVLLKEEAQKVGIEINLEVREWVVFLDEAKRRDFDLICSAWSHGPGLDDPKQIWHSDSDTEDGSNRVGFNNKEADKIIEEIRTTLDEEKRTLLYMRLQEIIHEELPYIFLCVPSERIMISKRIKKPTVSALRPGYQEMYFNLSKD
jgi:peptide/nickel transport system substrate-binding protein